MLAEGSESDVQKVIDELRELNKDDYTSASYDILSQAIAKAEKDMSKRRCRALTSQYRGDAVKHKKLL